MTKVKYVQSILPREGWFAKGAENGEVRLVCKGGKRAIVLPKGREVEWVLSLGKTKTGERLP